MSKMTQSEYNGYLKKAIQSVEEFLSKKLPKDSSYHIYHVYQGSGKGKGYKRHCGMFPKNIKGITFLVLKMNNEYIVYTAQCCKEDTYSRLFGRKEVLSKLHSDLLHKFKSNYQAFRVPAIHGYDKSIMDDALIQFTLMVNQYPKALGVVGLSTKPSKFIEQFGGVPLLLNHFYMFVESDGTVSVSHQIEAEDFDPKIYMDNNYKQNFREFFSKVNTSSSYSIGI